MNYPSSTNWRTRVNDGWTYTDRMDAEAAGWRCIEFYVRRYPHSTELQWQQRLQEGQICRDGHVLEAANVLQAGDRLVYRRPAWTVPPAPRWFAVLHDDGDLLAVAKPPGLQVLPAAGFLHNTLLHVVREKRGQQWAPAHRLGRGTSGIVLFTRSNAARRHVAAAFRDGGIRKTYRALVQGAPAADAFDVDQPIGRVPYPRLGYVHAAVANGQPSRSLVRVLERRDNDTTLVEVEIPTGRPHQIRIHMAAAGHPLVGEPLYVAGGCPAMPHGDRPPLPGDTGYHLHALRVELVTASGEPLVVECAAPAALRTTVP